MIAETTLVGGRHNGMLVCVEITHDEESELPRVILFAGARYARQPGTRSYHFVEELTR